MRPVAHAISAQRTIAVLELSTNDLRRIRAAVAMIQSEIRTMEPGAYRRIMIP
jgi:hypothetical protein